jgi:hypothetical protein
MLHAVIIIFVEDVAGPPLQHPKGAGHSNEQSIV